MTETQELNKQNGRTQLALLSKERKANRLILPDPNNMHSGGPLFSLRVHAAACRGPLDPPVLELKLDPSRGFDHAIANRRECLLIGDALLHGTKSSAEDLLALIPRRGPHSTAENLDGSFFILWLDHSQPAAYAISDITGSRKIFVHGDESALVFSDSLDGLDLRHVRIDPVALIEFILNGIPVQNRTVLDGVSLFPRATVAELSLPRPVYSTYWQYAFDDAHAGRSESVLINEFAEVLEEATRVRAAAATHPILVSLSGGYDSTCILGSLLACSDKNNIRAFSYAEKADAPNTDASVAHETCRRLGVEHHVVTLPKLSVDKILDLNADHGGAAANLCSEIGVWEALPELLPSYVVGADCFFGDNAFGHDPNWRICSVDEMFAYLPLATPVAYTAIEQIVNPCQRNGLREEFAARHHAFRALASSAGDVFKQRDFLYFDHRVSGALMPWRDFFCGIHLNPVNPLLDRNILEFFRHLPYPARRARILYKKTVRSLYPHLFSSRRAVFYGSGHDIALQMTANRNVLSHRLANMAPELASYIDIAVLQQWLDNIARTSTRKENPLKNIAKLCLKGSFLPELARSFSPRRFQIQRAEVISRALTVDSTLKLLSSRRSSDTAPAQP